MEIVVSMKKQWGREFFYPESDDACFLAKFTGRPTILKNQLRMAKDRGWTVKVIQKHIELDAYFNEKREKPKERPKGHTFN